MQGSPAVPNMAFEVCRLALVLLLLGSYNCTTQEAQVIRLLEISTVAFDKAMSLRELLYRQRKPDLTFVKENGVDLISVQGNGLCINECLEEGANNHIIMMAEQLLGSEEITSLQALIFR